MKNWIKTIFLCISLFALFSLTACQNGIPDAYSWPIQKFSFTNQDGQTFSNKDLQEKVTIVDFIYTSCPDVCIPMTANMAKLQNMVKKEKLDVQFVSFSIDPEVDTPQVLKTFGEKFHADFSNWNFLTGYSQQKIESLAKDNFKTLVQKASANDVIHGTRYYLIDQKGNIVKDYSGSVNPPYDEIINHIKILK